MHKVISNGTTGNFVYSEINLTVYEKTLQFFRLFEVITLATKNSYLPKTQWQFCKACRYQELVKNYNNLINRGKMFLLDKFCQI